MGTVVRSLTAFLLTASMWTSVAGARAEPFGEPRQLTLPPLTDVALDLGDSAVNDGLPDEGAVSVLPNRRNCAADVMILARPLAGAETPKLKGAPTERPGLSPGCQMTSADTNPAPILVAPPHGVQVPVSPYAAPAHNDAAETIITVP
jgi:hypothetical protein